MNCPFECEHLQEARRHERARDLAESDIPNRDIDVSDRFIDENNRLVSLSSRILLRAALEVPGVIDADIREAFGTLIRTHRTLESGLYYESRPNNPLAAAVHQGFQTRMTQARQEMARESGVNTIRDSAILGVLAFLERVALHYDNGRRRGRSFLHFLHDQFSSDPVPVGEPARPAGGSPLVIP